MQRLTSRPLVNRALFLAAIIALLWSAASARADAPAAGVSPDAALKMLTEGNQRFVDGKPEHPNQDAARRTDLAGGQHPFA